jgi:GT2 family glycosyltransferase
VIINYKDENRTIAYIQEEISKIECQHITVIVNNSATGESNDCLVSKLNATLVTDIKQKPASSNCYVISSTDNLGFAKGNNLGAEFSMSHFTISHILFSNTDIHFVDENVVERLVEKLDSLSSVGMIGPKVKGLDGKNQSPEPYITFWNRYIWMYWLTPFLSPDKKGKLFKLNYSQDALEGEHYKIMGSFFIIKALDFTNCGMMDPNTFLYAEETILTERLKAINKKVYYFPKVSVLHDHGKTIKRHFQKVESKKLQFESESYYYHTYKGVSSFSIALGKISVNLYFKLKFHF